MMQMLSQRLLSRNARGRLLDEMQENVAHKFTDDPAMPDSLRNTICALIRHVWADVAVEMDHHEAEDAEAERRASEHTAVPEIAQGVLQVLVVEARNLVTAHGIGTNPYVRGILGHQVRRSRTAWSTLSPAWSCLMDFPVVSLSGTLELEVMSQAPLFGGDSRLGYVSLPLKDIACQAQGRDNSKLAYRCETLQGVSQGELVLIVDYRPLGRVGFSNVLSGRCVGLRRIVCRWYEHFRAFFLYHYWPCDKSLFQMYLHEPIDICILLISLCPLISVRAVFYTTLLICLCVPWPPDEHQIIHYILATKGAAIFTDGIGPLFWAIWTYYRCSRRGDCAEGGAPGSEIGVVTLALDIYQEMLVWGVWFLVLPRTVPFRMRNSETTPASTAKSIDDGAGVSDENDTHRGGRMKPLFKYNFISFVISFSIFLFLCALDLIDGWLGGHWHGMWTWRVPENFFWSRVIFGLSMVPFPFLLHPKINELLTHSTATGFTRLGTLRRYKPPRLPRRMQEPDSRELVTSGEPESKHVPEQVSCIRDAQSPQDRNIGARRSVDPVEDLKTAVRRLPGGSIAVFFGGIGVRIGGLCVRTTCSVISLEIRAVSAAVSLGLRAVDASVSSTCTVARCIPGSGLTMRAGGVAVSGARRTGSVVLSGSARVVRHLPFGTSTLNALEQVLQTVGFLAASAESSGLSTEMTAPMLLQVGSERAEALKLEAAAQLAEMLTRAEHMAERDTTEAIKHVQTEINKITQSLETSLETQRKSFRDRLERGRIACDTLNKSLQAMAKDYALRSYSASRTLVTVALRELSDLQKQRPERKPGLKPALEAYFRVLVSSVCEACLELRPGSGQPVIPEKTVPEKAHSSHAGRQGTDLKRRRPLAPNVTSTDEFANASRRGRSQSPFLGARRRAASREWQRSSSPQTPDQDKDQ